MKKISITLTLAIASITSVSAQLPDPGFTIDENTAIVITDPQNYFTQNKKSCFPDPFFQ